MDQIAQGLVEFFAAYFIGITLTWIAVVFATSVIFWWVASWMLPYEEFAVMLKKIELHLGRQAQDQELKEMLKK